MSNLIKQAQRGLLTVWGKLPVIVRAILLGMIVMSIGVHSFSALISLNVKTTLLVPWAAIVMVPLLWVYWQYAGGRWWPQSNSQARKINLRARPLSRQVWFWAVLTGIIGIVFTFNFGNSFQRIMGVEMNPGALIPDGLEIPWWTLYPTFLMVSIVAGFCEEAGIRGYLQGMIERRHGPVVAILISASVFTYIHFGHDWGPAMALPFFVASLWYGTLTWITGSILPMVLVHISIDVYLFGKYLLFGTLGSTPPLSETGVDTAFIIAAATTIIAGVLLILVLWKLNKVVAQYPVED